MVGIRKFIKEKNDMLVSGFAVAFTLSLLLAVYIDAGQPSTMVRILASGLYQGMLYFMVAAGLSIVFGLMDVLNFAQGSLFMIGAYTGFEVLTSLPNHATADQRLLMIFILVNAPFLFLVLESLVLALVRKIVGKTFYQPTGSFWEKLAVIALVGVGLGFVVGTFTNSMAVQLVLAVLVGVLALLDVSRDTILFGLRYVGESISFFYERGWHTLNTQFINPTSTQLPPERHLPVWHTSRTNQDLVGVGIGMMGISALALWLMNVDVRIVHLGIAGTAAIFAGAVAGVLMERLFIRPTYSRPFFQIVLTFGLALVIREAIIWRYEHEPVGTLRNFLPPSLTGVIEGTTIFNYWIFMITMGLIMMIGVQLLLKRTRIGIIIRAGVQDSEMVEALGINVRLVFTVVFALGAAIAALGGVISGGFLNIDPAMGDAFLLQAIAVVIIGGLGSYAGTAIAAIMLGISRQVAAYFSRQYYNTDGLAPIVVLSLLCLILIVKPSGLFGKEH